MRGDVRLRIYTDAKYVHIPSSRGVSVEMQVWEEWHEENSPNYPHDKVIQFVFRNFQAVSKYPRKALDLGCGSGANACFLAEVGFDVTGIDGSETGLVNTNQRARAQGLTVETQLSRLSNFKVPREAFDLVISIGVFEFVDAHEAETAIARSHEALAAGGKALFLFAADTDFRHEAGGARLGIRRIRREEIDQLMAPFSGSTFSLDEYITTHDNDAYRQVDWLVTAEK